MNGADFDALFDSFARTALRIQRQPFYAVGGAEADRIAAFHRGAPRPERSVRTDPWLARIATTTVIDGKSWKRVCTVERPLNDDQRYRLVSHGESQAAGEQILLTDVAVAAGGDFWLFDAGTEGAFAVLMHYSDDGAVRHRELIPAGHPMLAELQTEAEGLTAAAVPLNAFLADLAATDA